MKKEFLDEVEALIKPRTSESPITGKYLADSTGSSPRIVRRAIADLRQASIPICSGPDGYWYGESAVEVQTTINDLKGRILAVEKAIKGLEKAKQIMDIDVTELLD